jgi:hypothetical protein
MKVPAALVDRFGTHPHIAAPVAFNHRGDEWADRVGARQAVRYDIIYEPQRGRWYLDASWTVTAAAAELDELRGGHVLGVDLNADHLAACVLDSSGNAVAEPITIQIDTAVLVATRRDGRVRAAITTLLDLAHKHTCTAIVVENLDFADARSTGRETVGRGRRGKRLRRTVAGIPTGKFRSRLTDTPTTTTRHAGPPENTHHQRPTPFGPHRTHSCSVTRSGRARPYARRNRPSARPPGAWSLRISVDSRVMAWKEIS